MNPYESEKLLSEYLLFHYGSEKEMLGEFPGPREALNFPARSVSELLALPCGPRALDIGCAVGRASFALAAHCEQVIGIDFSASFINTVRQLQQRGSFSYGASVERDIFEPRTARAPSHGEKIQFETGDAMCLRADLGAFNVVLAANLICRLPNPGHFLDRLPELVIPGGQLLLTTPFTWLEDYTPREHWLGRGNQRSFEALQEILAPHFELEHTCDLPFLIREHERKFQYTIAIGSRWRRR